MAVEYWTKRNVATFGGSLLVLGIFSRFALFNIELDEDVKCLLIKFVNGTKLGILHRLIDSRIVFKGISNIEKMDSQSIQCERNIYYVLPLYSDIQLHK